MYADNHHILWLLSYTQNNALLLSPTHRQQFFTKSYTQPTTISSGYISTYSVPSYNSLTLGLINKLPSHNCVLSSSWQFLFSEYIKSYCLLCRLLPYIQTTVLYSDYLLPYNQITILCQDYCFILKLLSDTQTIASCSDNCFILRQLSYTQTAV